MKDDGCGRSEYEVENFANQAGIFCFEGLDEGGPVWVVSPLFRGTRMVDSLTNLKS
jgi:hypothetical protein